jgi:hypothetical protein
MSSIGNEIIGTERIRSVDCSMSGSDDSLVLSSDSSCYATPSIPISSDNDIDTAECDRDYEIASTASSEDYSCFNLDDTDKFSMDDDDDDNDNDNEYEEEDDEPWDTDFSYWQAKANEKAQAKILAHAQYDRVMNATARYQQMVSANMEKHFRLDKDMTEQQHNDTLPTNSSVDVEDPGFEGGIFF